MKGKEYFLLILAFTFLSRFLVFPKASLWAADEASESVDATVKISVCGNNMKEGGEDCDKDDLDNQTCVSIGYGEGTLGCDIGCGFDISECGPAPTATPTPMATATPTPTPTTAAATATSAPGPTSTPAPAPTATPTPIVVTLVEIVPLPEKVATFDIDGDGQIAVQEVAEAVQLWVEEWRKEIKKVKVEITFPEEKKVVEREKPKGLIEKIWPFGKKKEELAEIEEELPLAVVSEEQSILGTVRLWVISRLGGEIPKPVPGLPAAEVLKTKLEEALETEEEKVAPVEEKKCDVNKDRECDLVDFSILLYYVNK